MDNAAQGPAAGKITGLKMQKGNRERVNLYVDGAFLMGLPALDAARLKIGQTLTADEIEALQALDTLGKLQDRAVKFLSYRPRSVAETERFLRQKGAEEVESAAIIAKLLELGYLNDREFARWWVENRSSFSPRGSYAIRQELRRKGVADDIVAEALEEANPDRPDLLEALARKRAGRLAGEDRPTFRRKLAAFLLRRGYSYQDIAPIVDTLWDEVQTQQET